MKMFAGKTANERNKIVAALVLGVVALFAMYMAFGSSIFSGSRPAAASASPTPPPKSNSKSGQNTFKGMPSQSEQMLGEATTDINYRPGDYVTPEPGRNIFAFHEPPPCYPNCPTPIPPATPVKTPSPSPTPPMRLTYVTPQTIYAGSASFRLEASGEMFDPSARLYFNQSELPTQFVSDKKLVANVPATMISSEGAKQVIAQTPDGKKYSDQVLVNVQPPPKPQFKYIGMIARARHNNDTAYFTTDANSPPVGARLNDVVGGRFRLVSISSTETIFEDVNLGFKHRLPLVNPPPGTATSSGPADNFRRGFPNDPNIYQQQNPNMQQYPGIPANIPQRPNQPGQRPTPKKDDDDDDDGGGGNP